MSRHMPCRGSYEMEIFMKKQEVKQKVKLLSLAVCSLGIWVLLGSFIDGSWVGIVFGAIAAILALVGVVKSD